MQKAQPGSGEAALPRHLRMPPEDMTEVRLERRDIHRGRIVTLHEDRVRMPSGREAGREVVDHPGAAAVLAVTGEGRAVLVWQYRYPTGGPLLEIPAGKLDPAEPPETCARRELAEETGYRAGRLVPLGAVYPSPGFSGEVLHLFCATDLTPGEPHPDADEMLSVVEVTAAQAAALVRERRLADLKTLAALAWWQTAILAGAMPGG